MFLTLSALLFQTLKRKSDCPGQTVSARIMWLYTFFQLELSRSVRLKKVEKVQKLTKKEEKHVTCTRTRAVHVSKHLTSPVNQARPGHQFSSKYIFSSSNIERVRDSDVKYVKQLKKTDSVFYMYFLSFIGGANGV